MLLDIWCGQFNIVGGQVQEEGPFVGIFEGTRQASGVGVYLVVEPVGPAPPRLCDEVIEVIAHAFGTPESGLTTNLSRAVAAAHQHVLEWNRTHGGERAAGLGLSCLAIRGGEALLAQCGPALALAHTGGRFQFVAPSGDDSRRPLGAGDQAAPVFTRLPVEPGDVILLTFSAADRLIDRGTLISLVNAPPDEAMPALYVRARDAEWFGALYLAASVAAAPVEPSMAPSSQRAAPEPRPRPRQPATRDQQRPEQPRPAPASATRGGAVRSAPRQTDRPSQGGSRNGYEPGGNWTGGDAGEPRRRVSMGGLGDGPRLPSQRTIIFIVFVALLLLLLLVAVPAWARRGTDERYDDLLRSADATIAGAEAEADPAHKLRLLTAAETDLVEARAIQPESKEVKDRLRRVTGALSTIDGAREPAEVADLANLSDAGVTPQTAVQLAVGDKVYLLDVAAGRVLAYALDGDTPTETVFHEGQAIGPERTGKARHLVLVPDAAGRPGTLMVLDGNRRLFFLAADGAWRATPLPGAEAWKAPTAIAVTTSALYVLDAPGERIWRYTGTPAGYDGQPEPLVTRPSLRQAVDLSISAVPVVATGDSRLLRIVEGRDEELRPSALSRPLSAPSAPVFNPSDGLLYIVDRGNRRIVLLEATGAFAGQIVNRRFGALRALALDETRGTIYAISGQALIKASLPR